MTSPHVPIDLTGHHFAIASAAAGRAESDGEQASVAVVFSAAAFEAFLASVVLTAQIRFPGETTPAPRGVSSLPEVLPVLEDSSASWSVKLQVIAVLLTGSVLQRGQQPYQDLDLLFKLRNTLLHPKLTWNPVAVEDPKAEHHRVVQAVLLRGAVNEPDPFPGFPDLVGDGKPIMPPATMSLFQPGVARWAVGVARDSMQQVIRMAEPSEFRRRLEWVHEVNTRDSRRAV